jgi:hypothetical protein
MSQRSRRFQSAKEAATHPDAVHHAASTGTAEMPVLVPSLSDPIAEAGKDFNFSGVIAKLRNEVDKQVKSHGSLERSKERIHELTSQMVTWGKRHPIRTAVAAATLVAVSGFLFRLMHGKAAKVAAVIAVAKGAKAGVKRMVRGRKTALAAT